MRRTGAEDIWRRVKAVQVEPLFLLQFGIPPVSLGQTRFKIVNKVN